MSNLWVSPDDLAFLKKLALKEEWTLLEDGEIDQAIGLEARKLCEIAVSKYSWPHAWLARLTYEGRRELARA